jgi:hypothetical protein
MEPGYQDRVDAIGGAVVTPARPATRWHLAGAAIGLVAAACSTPTPGLQLQLAQGDSQGCPSIDCKEVPLPCDAVMSIRIADPEDTAAPFYSDCVPIPYDTNHTMCSLGRIELDENVLLPVRDLEVQIAIYPATMIEADPTARSGLRCPADVKFSAATGYPVEQSPGPALGGRAFYHPGDASVVVTLGCTDLAAIEQSCAQPDSFRIAATVDDFENLFPVPSGGAASQLRVSVGEPRLIDGVYMLTSESSRPLRPVPESRTIATWGDDIDLAFDRYVCVEVFETVPETTGALRCSEVSPATHLDDLHGVRISKDTLAKVLGAMGPMPSLPLDFPEDGLTIGIVADQASNPIEGMIVGSVSSEVSTVKYLSREGILVDGATSKTGVFVSTNAPFGTTFFTSGGPGGRHEISALGGRVSGRVTVVILQYAGLPL